MSLRTIGTGSQNSYVGAKEQDKFKEILTRERKRIQLEVENEVKKKIRVSKKLHWERKKKV